MVKASISENKLSGSIVHEIDEETFEVLAKRI
jgi:hypothetical protein